MSTVREGRLRTRQIRDEAERALHDAGGPLHNMELAKRVLPRLGLNETITPKALNTIMHDDPDRRFVRVARGTWDLRTRQHRAV